jgi:hypothetical protein
VGVAGNPHHTRWQEDKEVVGDHGQPSSRDSPLCTINGNHLARVTACIGLFKLADIPKTARAPAELVRPATIAGTSGTVRRFNKAAGGRNNRKQNTRPG